MVAATEVGRQAGGWAAAIDRVIAVHLEHPDEGEQGRRLPEPVFQAMRKEGLFRLWVPKEYGGSEIELAPFMEAVERFAKQDAALAWTFAILAAGPLMTAYLPADGALEIFASGPNVPIPGAVATKGRLVPAVGGYRASGRWPLGSGSHYGEWISATGMIFDGDAPRMGPHGGPDIIAFFVRQEERQLIDTWDSMGLRGTGSVDFAIEDVFVPETRMFPLFSTPSQVAAPLYKAGPLALFSLAIAAVMPGVARHAIDAFVEMAMEKTPTLSQTGLAVRPTIHAGVARAEALLGSSRAYLYEVAQEITDCLANEPMITDELEAKRRLACVNVATACTKAVDSVFELAGATPVYSGHELERCLRDIRTARQHLLMSPVWWEKTGQYYFGHGLGMP